LTDFLKFSLKNPCSGRQVVVGRQTGMRKLIVAFRNFVNMLKNHLRMLIDAISVLVAKFRHCVPPTRFTNSGVRLGSSSCSL